MIKVSIMYPYSEGADFDMAYYCEKHMPMVRQRMGSACKGVEVEQGIGGEKPGTPPAYIAMGHIYCETVEAFSAAFGPHAAEFKADKANYTKIDPDRPDKRDQGIGAAGWSVEKNRKGHYIADKPTRSIRSGAASFGVIDTAGQALCHHGRGGSGGYSTSNTV